jgi:hypothetical protein
MTIVLAMLLTALLGVSAWLGVEIRKMSRFVETLIQETRTLRLISRTRVKTISVRNGPVTEESRIRRLGRSSAAKRIVYGGDPESPLHTNLSRSLGVIEDERAGI